MTEKRFIVKAQPPLWTTSDGIEIESARQDLFDTFEDKTICQFEYSTNTEKMIDLMNSLSEENEQLKQQNKEFKSTVEYLKSQLKNYSEVCPNGKWILNQGDFE